MAEWDGRVGGCLGPRAVRARAGSPVQTVAKSAKTNLALNPVLSADGAPSPAELSKPVFPTLRLQGIFYRPKNPSALINAKTISIGGKVASAKVIAITRESVTLEWNGETKVLTLE